MQLGKEEPRLPAALKGERALKCDKFKKVTEVSNLDE